MKHGEPRTYLHAGRAGETQGTDGTEVVTNAFLDQGSSSSFFTDRLADQLCVPKQETRIELSTVMGRARDVRSTYIEGVEISPLVGNEYFKLPPLFTLTDLPMSSSDVCKAEQVNKWDHLTGVELHHLNAPVGLLLGSNAAGLLVAKEVKSPAAGEDGPYGVRGDLGWYVIGKATSGFDGRRMVVNFLRVHESKGSDVTNMFEKIYEQDFADVADNRFVTISALCNFST